MSNAWKTYTGDLPDLDQCRDLDSLIVALATFCDVTGAPRFCAMELFNECPNNHVSAWLDAYLMRWDESESVQ